MEILSVGFRLPLTVFSTSARSCASCAHNGCVCVRHIRRRRLRLRRRRRSDRSRAKFPVTLLMRVPYVHTVHYCTSSACVRCFRVSSAIARRPLVRPSRSKLRAPRLLPRPVRLPPARSRVRDSSRSAHRLAKKISDSGCCDPVLTTKKSEKRRVPSKRTANVWTNSAFRLIA